MIGKNQKRDTFVDLLKCIGIIGVIIAHLSPPEWLFIARSFDVIALVYASGLTLKWQGENFKDYLNYIIKRFKRLIIPTWIFITLYWGIITVFIPLGLIPETYALSTKHVLMSYTCCGGIGYFWIIRVYFTLAIVSPIIYVISNNTFFKRYWTFLLTIIVIINEFCAQYSDLIESEILRNLFKGIVVYTIGYSIVEVIAKLSRSKSIYGLLIYSLIVFFISWCLNNFCSPNDLKYPPQMCYLFYGISIVLIIKWVYENFTKYLSSNFVKIVKGVIVWISNQSLWIYFWHIAAIPFSRAIATNFIERFLFVFSLSCVLTYLQIIFLHKKQIKICQ